jgi:hypothetical protein
MSIDALIHTASSATSVLRQVTSGKDAEDHAGTNVRTLQQLTEILERMADELASRRASDRHEAALERIAGLKVRSAGELIEHGKWKKLAEELQSIAQSALNPEGATGR